MMRRLLGGNITRDAAAPRRTGKKKRQNKKRVPNSMPASEAVGQTRTEYMVENAPDWARLLRFSTRPVQVFVKNDVGKCPTFSEAASFSSSLKGYVVVIRYVRLNSF